MGFLLPSCGHLVLCEQRPELQMAHAVVVALLGPSKLPLRGNTQDMQVQNWSELLTRVVFGAAAFSSAVA